VVGVVGFVVVDGVSDLGFWDWCGDGVGGSECVVDDAVRQCEGVDDVGVSASVADVAGDSAGCACDDGDSADYVVDVVDALYGCGWVPVGGAVDECGCACAYGGVVGDVGYHAGISDGDGGGEGGGEYVADASLDSGDVLFGCVAGGGE